MVVVGKITRMPLVREKVIFSSIQSNDDQEQIELVLFRNSRPAKDAKYLSDRSIGDLIRFEGRIQTNPQTRKNQYIIDQIIDQDEAYNEFRLDLVKESIKCDHDSGLKPYCDACGEALVFKF